MGKININGIKSTQEAIIYSFWKTGLSFSQIRRKLSTLYGKGTFEDETVFEWIQVFKKAEDASKNKKTVDIPSTSSTSPPRKVVVIDLKNVYQTNSMVIDNVIQNVPSKDNRTPNSSNTLQRLPIIDELLWMIRDFHEFNSDYAWYQKVKGLSSEYFKAILNKLCINGNVSPSYLKVLLLLWTGYKMKHKANDDDRTRRTILYLELWKYLLEKLNSKDENNEFNSGLNIVCSYKTLKTMFLPHPTEAQVYDMRPYTSETEYLDITMSNVMYWPYIDIVVVTKQFTMQHANNHLSEFRAVNLKNASLPVWNSVDTRIYNKHRNLLNSKINPNLVKSYIEQLKDHVRLYFKGAFQYHLLIILNVMCNDIVLLSDDFHVSAKYFRNLSQYPYYRYLDHRKSDLDKKLEVRLEQVLYPALSFEVSIFKAQPDRLDFRIEDDVESLKKMINIQCSLCKVSFISVKNFNEIFEHVRSHGYEPGWKCTKCNKAFSNSFITSNKWCHICDDS